VIKSEGFGDFQVSVREEVNLKPEPTRWCKPETRNDKIDHTKVNHKSTRKMSDTLTKATTTVSRAIAADNENDLPLAIGLYTQAISEFHVAITWEMNPSTRELIKKRVEGYTARLCLLEKRIMTKEVPSVSFTDMLAEIFLSERNWGTLSPYALVSVYERTNMEFVIQLMEHPKFKASHIPGIRIYKLVKELKNPIECETVTRKAAELGIEIVELK
jgi:hypothetical protein